MTLLNRILLKLFGVRLVTSQCGEDLIVESMIPSQKMGFYVDIGANHPIRYSNTFLFYKKGWHGINIEPDSSRIFLFKLLRRRDLNLNVGIGEEKSVKDLYCFETNTLNTFDKKSAERYEANGHKIKSVKKVKILPLKELFDKNLHDNKIDIMSVDTEGYDMTVLRSNDWDKYRPKFIILETIEYKRNENGRKFNDEYDPYMDSIGYTKVADTNINTIYKDKSSIN